MYSHLFSKITVGGKELKNRAHHGAHVPRLRRGGRDRERTVSGALSAAWRKAESGWLWLRTRLLITHRRRLQPDSAAWTRTITWQA